MRLEDNTALFHALKTRENVLLMFNFNPDILERLEVRPDFRVNFIYKTLVRIKETLEKIGSSIYVAPSGGLPAPRTQVSVGRDRVDFLWPRYRTVGEADGMLKYDDAEPGRLRAEKLRQERLEESGLTVVRFTWHQVEYEPARTVERFRQAFARAEAA